MRLAVLRITLAKGLRAMEEMPRGVEVALFILVAVAAAGSRFLYFKELPTYLWSKDTMSYAHPSFEWLRTGEWMIDGRRGPVYTMFLGYAAKLWGSFDGVMIIQHILECVAVLFTVFCARLHLGRRSAWVVYPCGYALAVCGIGMRMGHLMRVESLLFFFSATALGCWSLAIAKHSTGWLAFAGAMAGLLTLTKNVFLPFPVIALAGVIYLFRRTPTRLFLHSLAFVAAFAFPFLLKVWHDKTARWVDVPKPQSGILLYGRTAQWTVLDHGIEPEMKAVIRADIEDYRKRKKPDNNVIIKDTAVPHMWAVLRERGMSPADLDRLCRKLALEAIEAHPDAFLSQAVHDVWRMQMSFGAGASVPDVGELKLSSRLLAEIDDPHPILDVGQSRNIVEASLGRHQFRPLERIQKTAWLFQGKPVFLTTLAVLLLAFLTRSEARLLWIGHAAIWCFTMVLLSTVGRPLNRYLIPVVPIMFWTLTACLCAIVAWLSNRLQTPDAGVHSPSARG